MRLTKADHQELRERSKPKAKSGVGCTDFVRTKQDRKKRFIECLAQFLVGDQGSKSVLLQMEKERPPDDSRPKLAEEWATMRNATPISGWADEDEAIKVLTEFLS